MNDYLSKPLVRVDLLAMIARWLPPQGVPASAADAADQELPASAADPGDQEARASTEDAGEPLLDEVCLLKLEQDVGPELLITLVASFTAELERRLGRVQAAQASGDLGTLALEVHAIKGSAATFGAPALSALALTLERAARSGEAALARGTLPDLMAVAAGTRALLDQRFGGHPEEAGVEAVSSAARPARPSFSGHPEGAGAEASPAGIHPPEPAPGRTRLLSEDQR